MRVIALVASILLGFCLLLQSSTAQSNFNSSQTGATSQYDLSVKILPEKHRLEVRGIWQIPAINSERNQIEFYLSPKMENLQIEIVEPQTSAPLTLESSKEDGGDTKWIFKLSRPVAINQSVLVRFSYDSENKTAPQFNISPEGSFVGGGGELWYPQSSFKERETGTLRFFVPQGETAVSNGESTSSTAQKARGEFIFRVTAPSKFGFAAGKYQVLRRAGRVPFALYLLNGNEKAQEFLDGCAKALNFLTTLFGAFPYQEFSLVEIDFRSGVAGTGEFGFILADDTEFKNFNLSYWAHEIGHQWWGNVVRSKSGEFGQMMFSEGMTQFSALQAVEFAEGEKAAEDFRLYGYRGIRKTHSAKGYFELVSSGKDFPLTLYKPKNQDEILLMHRLANSKGFILMDMLSRKIGRKKFAAILKRFIREHAEQLTSWHEFQKFIEANSGQDIHWFFEQWFERTGAPDYQLDWKQEGKIVSGKITQPAPYFRSTLEVEIVGANNRRILKTVEIIGDKIEFNWRMLFKVKSVVLDPHYKVLHWTQEFRKQDRVN